MLDTFLMIFCIMKDRKPLKSRRDKGAKMPRTEDNAEQKTGKKYIGPWFIRWGPT